MEIHIEILYGNVYGKFLLVITPSNLLYIFIWLEKDYNMSVVHILQYRINRKTK